MNSGHLCAWRALCAVRLPQIVTPRNKSLVGWLTLAALVGTYFVTNALQFRTPVALVPSALDRAVPLIPATIWIYASYPALFVSACAIERDPLQLTRFFYADVGANVLSEVLFVLVPTSFARPPLGPAPHSLAEGALALLWRYDDPVNCFPSLHVSTTLLPTLMLYRHHRKLFWPYLVWALAIVFSTMSTEQHHVLDVAGGTLVAAAMYWLFFARARYAPPRAQGRAIGARGGAD